MADIPVESVPHGLAPRDISQNQYFGIARHVVYLTCARADAPIALPTVAVLTGDTGRHVAAASASHEVTAVKTILRVNHTTHELLIDPRLTLLDALRDELGLTGTKKGCDQGACGACTVIVDGQRVLSCLTLAAECEGQHVVTIESLSSGGDLHPMQAAFLHCDAFQCGYCTPGQILSAFCVVEEVHAGVPSHVTPDVRATVSAATLTDEEVRERMSGNLCRCGAYPNIVAAVRQVLVQDGRS